MSNNKSQILKVLFIASANKGAMTPVVINQAEALIAEGVQVDFFEIRGKGFRGYMRNVNPLRKYLHTHQYDAIHAHYSLSAFAASLAGAEPLVVSLMGSDVKAAGWYKFIIRFFAFLFRWKAIIVKSNDMYRSLGIKRAVVIPNGVNLDRFRPMDKTECQKRLGWQTTNDKPQTTNHNPQTTNHKSQTTNIKHVLFPANASRPEKDYALAEAAVAAANQHLSFVIGNLSENDEPQTTNHKLQTTNTHVILHAFNNTPNEETPYWYNAADVVLMTSKWEGSPNAIKEAMACCRPIVATNVGDIAERTSGVEGCFVAHSREPEELARVLQQAIAFADTKGREQIISDGLDAHVVNGKLIRLY